MLDTYREYYNNTAVLQYSHKLLPRCLIQYYILDRYRPTSCV